MEYAEARSVYDLALDVNLLINEETIEKGIKPNLIGNIMFTKYSDLIQGKPDYKACSIATAFVNYQILHDLKLLDKFEYRIPDTETCKKIGVVYKEGIMLDDPENSPAITGNIERIYDTANEIANSIIKESIEHNEMPKLVSNCRVSTKYKNQWATISSSMITWLANDIIIKTCYLDYDLDSLKEKEKIKESFKVKVKKIKE